MTDAEFTAALDEIAEDMGTYDPSDEHDYFRDGWE